MLTTLSSKEFCEIIHACAEKGVAFLKITNSGVEIKFNQVAPSEVFKQSQAESLPQATLNQTQGAEQLPVQSRDPEQIEREDELEELQISNPLEYEERLARGELINAEPSGTDTTDSE